MNDLALDATRRSIVAAVDDSLVLDLARKVIEIPSPTGEEEPFARFLVDTMREAGFTAATQEIYPGRVNAVGRLNGGTRGATVLLSGHMDTSVRGDEDWLRGAGFKNRAVVRDGLLFGNGIFNMKNAFPCYFGALDALRRVLGALPGQVILAGTAGEVEQAPIDEFKGPAYDGYGVGMRFLLTHGYTADYHILGEPTGMTPLLGNWGTTWAKVSTQGEFAHTAWSDSHLSAIEEMWTLWRALDPWIARHRADHGYMGVVPQVNRAAIGGGLPWKAARTPASCDMYIDIRVPPDKRMIDVQQGFEQEVLRIAAEKLRKPASVHWYVSRPGTVIDASERVVQSICRAHETVYGAPTAPSFAPPWCSDATDSNRYGIPTVIYGQGRLAKPGTAAAHHAKDLRIKEGEFVHIEDLYRATRIYALALHDLLNAVPAGR
jgi:acetylornithine deacetylase/succinyl-diaminopimelate desuccinylase-like protein